MRRDKKRRQEQGKDVNILVSTGRMTALQQMRLVTLHTKTYRPVYQVWMEEIGAQGNRLVLSLQ